MMPTNTVLRFFALAFCAVSVAGDEKHLKQDMAKLGNYLANAIREELFSQCRNKKIKLNDTDISFPVDKPMVKNGSVALDFVLNPEFQIELELQMNMTVNNADNAAFRLTINVQCEFKKYDFMNYKDRVFECDFPVVKLQLPKEVAKLKVAANEFFSRREVRNIQTPTGVIHNLLNSERMTDVRDEMQLMMLHKFGTKCLSISTDPTTSLTKRQNICGTLLKSKSTSVPLEKM